MSGCISHFQRNLSPFFFLWPKNGQTPQETERERTKKKNHQNNIAQHHIFILRYTQGEMVKGANEFGEEGFSPAAEFFYCGWIPTWVGIYYSYYLWTARRSSSSCSWGGWGQSGTRGDQSKRSINPHQGWIDRSSLPHHLPPLHYQSFWAQAWMHPGFLVGLVTILQSFSFFLRRSCEWPAAAAEADAATREQRKKRKKKRKRLWRLFSPTVSAWDMFLMGKKNGGGSPETEAAAGRRFHWRGRRTRRPETGGCQAIITWWTRA